MHRHPTTTEQLDLFIADLVDVPLRDQRDLMAVPTFALGKNRRIEPIRYERGDVWLEVTAPAEFGIATIWDADVLLWCVSQINEAIERGAPHSSRLEFQPYNLLRAIHRGTSGKHYNELRAALDRLRATTVRTNLRVPGGRKTATFGWLESWREDLDEQGRSRGIIVELPQWLYEAVRDQQVLSIAPAYFDISSGLARWLYRVVRKHAGRQQSGWAFTFRDLHEKSGSTQRFSDFSRQLRKITDANELPEYHLTRFKGERGDACLHAVRRTLLADRHPAHDDRLRESRKRTAPQRGTA
jgi:plasmid replication initiation protein